MRDERIDPIAEWLAFIQEGSDGLVLGANVLREKGLNLSRQTAEDEAALAQAIGLGEDPSKETGAPPVPNDPWPIFSDVLGWPKERVAGLPGGPELPEGLVVTLPDQDDYLQPDWAVMDAEGTPQLLVAIERDLGPDERNTGADGWEASPHQRLDRLIRETNVEVGILLAPGILRLVYAPKGETSGWMTWPLAPMTQPSGRPMLAGLKLALGRRRLFVGPEDQRLRPLLEESRKAQNVVSQKLSGQVLGALHDLLRGLHAADPHRIERLAQEYPEHLYEGMLTFLMRLVFLLYAEDRDLLPTSRAPEARQLWQSGYSIRTLFTRLDDDAARHFDTMEDRRGGWGQLLAAFRLVHAGHDNWIKGRGGKLFGPDAFPFLEGREHDEAPQVLPVSDACVHRVLEGLTTLRGPNRDDARERLSYRTLDVEQIGSVYETVMGFTAQAAPERMIALSDEKGLPTFIGLETLLATKPKDRAKWLKDHAVKLTAKQTTALKAAETEVSAIAALAEGQARGHKIGAIDLRGSPDQHALPAGAPFLQPTDERRRSGSHYTPRELTAPIVTHALEPVLARIGERATPDDVLRLKVCDPACGSGAFLVEACRQLGDRLVKAWERHPYARPGIPPDESEEIHARRLVAQRCLYGVDKNPMAADLARLSLWLATLAAEHEFTFLNHAVKSGDSLVGLSARQIERAQWAEGPGAPLLEGLIADRVRQAEDLRDNVRDAPDAATMAERERWHLHAEDVLNQPRLYGDAVIGAFFSEDKARAREKARVEVEQILTAPGTPDYDALERWAAHSELEPFHWELEFPEVFDPERRDDNPGFDAIVGNPPFAGKNTISAMGGPRYIPWLQALHPGAHGNADLVAHFFRRAYVLLREGGALGLIATNTIGQGDTRATGLRPILAEGGTIMRAIRRLRWPGEAVVVVSVVHVRKGEWSNPVLDKRLVGRISAYLVEGDYDESPEPLPENENTAFQGLILLGMGFTFDDEAASKGDAEPLAEMERLIAEDPRNAERIKPYIGGDEVNSSPTHAFRRYAIDFEDFPLRRERSLKSWFLSEGTVACEKRRRDWLRNGIVPEDFPGPVAQDWPDLLAIVERRVKPQRLKQSDAGGRKYWWRYLRMRGELRAATADIQNAWALSRVSPNLGIARASTAPVFADSTVIFAHAAFAPFSVLQSRVHEVWARYLSSSMKDDLRYAPTDCLETFPFPQGYENDPILEDAGRAYHDFRADLMVTADEGMSTTYKRFNDHAERSNSIARLRDLHAEMDAAVLRAYRWNDLAESLTAAFLAKPADEKGQGERPGQPEDEFTYQGRLFWPQAGRDTVLARLIALNATRAAGEPDPTYEAAGEEPEVAE